MSKAMTPAPPGVPGKPGPLALLGKLTPRDRAILHTLADHDVLTTSQVAELAFGSLRHAQTRLAALARLAVVGRFRSSLPAGSEPWKYYLAPAGAALIAAERGQPPPAPRVVEQRALALAASPRLGHLLGVNGFFTALAAAARASGGACTLAAWHSERRCAADLGDIVRPDGYGAWARGGRVTSFYLEYDTGSETTARAAGKLAGYRDLATATSAPVLVLYWLPAPGRETGLRAALARASAAGVLAATGTPALGGPAGPVWLPIGAGRRVPLAGLTPLAASQIGRGVN
jgi:DNA-binding CsgD family transcriptional regulator